MTPERLQRIDRAESALRALGVLGNLRVRDHGELARVEVDAGDVARISAEPMVSRIATALRAAGFERTEIDPAGFRSGSLNVLVGIFARSKADADLPGDQPTC